MNEGAQFLARELRHLIRSPIGSKTELAAWYIESMRIQKALQEQFSHLEFPEDIWHFLSDADVRAKDAGYRKRQEQIVNDFIASLENESAP